MACTYVTVKVRLPDQFPTHMCLSGPAGSTGRLLLGGCFHDRGPELKTCLLFTEFPPRAQKPYLRPCSWAIAWLSSPEASTGILLSFPGQHADVRTQVASLGGTHALAGSLVMCQD